MKLNSDIKGDQLFTYVNYLNEFITEKIWNTARYQIETERISYIIVHKLRSLLDTSSLLLKNTDIDSKPHYFDCLFLILRTCLSDAICLYYIIDESGNHANLTKRINRILADHIRYKYIESETEDMKNEIIAMYPDYFENGKFKDNIFKKISAIIMDREIEDSTLKFYSSEALKIYKDFSKMEHNGILSFDILHNHYCEDTIEDDKRKAINAVNLTIPAINMTLQLWNDKNDILLKKIVAQSKKLLPTKEDNYLTRPCLKPTEYPHLFL